MRGDGAILDGVIGDSGRSRALPLRGVDVMVRRVNDDDGVGDDGMGNVLDTARDDGLFARLPDENDDGGASDVVDDDDPNVTGVIGADGVMIVDGVGVNTGSGNDDVDADTDNDNDDGVIPVGGDRGDGNDGNDM
jgi:hypothetical protein